MAARKIHSVAEIAAADRAAIAAGTPGQELMERAGAAVADAIVERFSLRPVAVLCGPGNNGGDGYVVARLLKERGWPVEVRALAPPETPDAKSAAARWDGPNTPFDAPLEARLFVDAMFGAGLSRPMNGDAAAVASRLADRPESVVAIDVPSGVPGDTGRPLGAAVCAGLTVTFHAKKLAHVLEPGHSLCGEVIVGKSVV